MSFANMIKPTVQSDLERLTKHSEKMTGGGFVKDERYWRPVIGPDGSGSAIIRFLPVSAHDLDREPPVNHEKNQPYIQRFQYAFKNEETNRWFIEHSPQSIALPCPVSEAWALTKKGDDLYKLLTRKRRFIANILVVKHPARQEDEGKVFLYEFGTTILDKIMEKMTVDKTEAALGDDARQAFDPFHLVEGANFRIKIEKKGGFPNFDKSEVLTQSAIAKSEAVMRKIWESEYSLFDELAPEKFKSYDAMKARLDQVLGNGPKPVSRPRANDTSNDSDNTAPPFDVDTPAVGEAASDDGDEDENDFIRNLAKRKNTVSA